MAGYSLDAFLYCQHMAGVIDADDLLFAPVRARWLEPAEAVVADLLDAAGQPGCMRGVRPDEVLVAAGKVLSGAGRLEEAGRVMRRAVAAAAPGGDRDARHWLAAVLIDSGDGDGAEEVIAGMAEGGPHAGIAERVAFALRCAAAGDDQRAARWAQLAVDHARRDRLGARVAELARLTQEQVRQVASERAAASLARATPGPGEGEPGATRPPAVAGNGADVLWWPQAEYERLVRYLPGLGQALGSPWRSHVARTEVLLRQRQAEGLLRSRLHAGEFIRFLGYVMQTGTDPRQTRSLGGFLANWPPSGPGTAWPPRPRQHCWCGSGRRYKDCCGTVVR